MKNNYHINMNKKAFTLIEVIIATSILTISVFWVYKLISQNSKIIENSNNYLNTTLLFPVLENCIENLDLNLDINDSRFFNLWGNLKECSAYDEEKINSIDNISYILHAKLKQNSGTWTIWGTKIVSDFTWTHTWTYIQKK